MQPDELRDSANDERVPPISAVHRCVCGHDISVDARTAITCPSCERVYPPGTFDKQSMPETTTFAVTSDGQPSLAGLDSEPLQGRRLGHFEVLRLLGQGGMGTVYYALDLSLERYVALKVLTSPEDRKGETRNHDAVLQEARLQARFNHPHIVTVYYVSTDEELPFFAMEYVDGSSLAELLRSGPLPLRQLIRLALQLAEALNDTTAAGVLHGDVKPANILVDREFSAKLTDFGVARVRGPQTQVGGTPRYMAPEVLRGSPADIASDMYSLGVTLFEATFGFIPFSDGCQDLAALLKAKENASVAFPGDQQSTVPSAWTGILASLLSPDPGKRPRSYRRLIRDLVAILPSSSANAGWLPRLLATYIDNALLATILFLPPFIAASVFRISMVEVTTSHQTLALFLSVAFLPIPLLGSLLQSRWGTSPGKKLFHLCIVDENGFRPGRGTLAIRAAFQLLPVWSLAVIGVVGNLYLDSLAITLAAAATLFFAVDCAVLLIRPRGRTLHDRLLGTRVAIDTAVQPAA